MEQSSNHIELIREEAAHEEKVKMDDLEQKLQNDENDENDDDDDDDYIDSDEFVAEPIQWTRGQKIAYDLITNHNKQRQHDEYVLLYIYMFIYIFYIKYLYNLYIKKKWIKAIINATYGNSRNREKFLN